METKVIGRYTIHCFDGSFGWFPFLSPIIKYDFNIFTSCNRGTYILHYNFREQIVLVEEVILQLVTASLTNCNAIMRFNYS